MTKTHIEKVNFVDALKDRYLSYALSTIMSRSLPDVRDGLKPVNRRILFAMQQMKLNPAGMTKKCARIIGDVMGKFHPHGEAAIYGTMVRLAQDFTLRYPLIEGQGNFGNIDGDNAAAMRYTEAKLTAVAEAMLQGLDTDAVPFKPSYDGESLEPIVLPGAFPNLLANGVVGIAVGMATSIPPHNADELCQALIHLIEHPDASVKDLVSFVKGPDFPTGGVLVESEQSILESYETGRGSFRLRCAYEVEQLKGGGYQIIVTQMPYMVQKGKLIERIAELLLAKSLPLLGDIQDESTDDVRLILVPKSKNVDPTMLMAMLYKHTDLEVKVPLNLNVVDKNNRPGVMNLKEALQAFLDHRQDVLERSTLHRLDQIQRRLEILNGYMIVYLNLDEVLRIIRFEDNPKEVMQAKWGLTDLQVEAILNMRLRALQKLEKLAIETELTDLQREQKDLKALLEDPQKRWASIKAQVKDIQKKFGQHTTLGARRTLVSGPVDEPVLKIEEVIEREPVTVILSQKGWIRVLKGWTDTDTKYKDGDGERFVIKAESINKLLIFTSDGRVFTLSVHTLPGGRGFGEPLTMIVDMEQGVDIVDVQVVSSDASDLFLLASKDGRGFIAGVPSLLAYTKNGKKILTVTGPQDGKIFRKVTGDHVAVIGENRRLLVFKVDELPQMAKGRGVMLQKYRGGGLADVTFFNETTGLTWTNGGRTFEAKEWQKWISKRGAPGRFAPAGFPRSNRF